MKKNRNDDIIRTTKEGRMYIETSDFFQQKKVKAIIKLKTSFISKSIQEHKNQKCEGA